MRCGLLHNAKSRMFVPRSAHVRVHGQQIHYHACNWYIGDDGLEFAQKQENRTTRQQLGLENGWKEEKAKSWASEEDFFFTDPYTLRIDS